MNVVLIVDDADDLLEPLQLAFQLEGITPATATSGADALRLLGQIAPDAIVSDVNMPGMDGAEFCSAVRSHPTFEDVPIVVVSALEESSVRERFECFDAYLQEPFRMDELIAVVRLQVTRKVADGSRTKAKEGFPFGAAALAFLGR